MVTCKFYQQGNCKFGDRCKYDHPGASQGRRQDAPQNRHQGFAAQRAPSGYDNRQSGGRQQRNNNADLPFHLSTRTIHEDLTVELPTWPLSSYGPGRDAPRQLIEGENEQSPEEMRTLFYLANLQNNPQSAIQDEQARAANAQGQIQSILSDLEGACQYILDGQKQHPNRWDVCNEASNANRGQRGHQQRPPDFRNQRANPFNLHQQSGAQTAGGHTPVNPFGKPSPVNPFGAPPTQTPANPFNNAPAAQAPAFGRPSQPQNPFGQPPPTKPVNPFGQPPATQPVNPFGQPPPSRGLQPPNPFPQSGYPNGSGDAPKPQNPFGQPPAAQSTAPTAHPFGTASPFAKPAHPAAAPTNPTWGQQPPTSNSFGTPAPLSNGFVSAPHASRAAPPQTNGFTSSSGRTPGQPQRAAGGNHQSQDYYADTEAPLQDYGPEGSEKRMALEETYRKANETGRFDGPVPEEPPLHQWRDYTL